MKKKIEVCFCCFFLFQKYSPLTTIKSHYWYLHHLYVRDFTVSSRQTCTRQNNDLANNVKLKKKRKLNKIAIVVRIPPIIRIIIFFVYSFFSDYRISPRIEHRDFAKIATNNNNNDNQVSITISTDSFGVLMEHKVKLTDCLSLNLLR